MFKKNWKNWSANVAKLFGTVAAIPKFMTMLFNNLDAKTQCGAKGAAKAGAKGKGKLKIKVKAPKVKIGGKAKAGAKAKAGGKLKVKIGGKAKAGAKAKVGGKSKLKVKIGSKGSAKGKAKAGGKIKLKLKIGGKKKGRISASKWAAGTKCRTDFNLLWNSVYTLNSYKSTFKKQTLGCVKALSIFRAQMTCAVCDPSVGDAWKSGMPINKAGMTNMLNACVPTLYAINTFFKPTLVR